ncbi:MAG: Gfo/Idh/MocA family oxidoreductase [Verrucomicrobiae bacterium]|nr:Gfo/Idh/MocA family oxidoreductase [Verrucomicrobiae bacterium]
MNSAPLKAGILGCGNISSAYFKGLKPYEEFIKIVACADIREEAAIAQATKYRILRVLSPDALFADREIEIIINLTTPPRHAPLNRKALEHGKHVYCEKPFGLNLEEVEGLLDLAKKNGLKLSCAPDTILGGVHQTCRELIEKGLIGVPNAATAFFANPGHEHWHPNPDFYYQHGGGPLFDMGPYYLHALGQLLGPACSVLARTKRAFEQRQIHSEARKGQSIKVEVDTHATGLIEYCNGVVATTLFSFDCMGRANLPFIEVYGSEGTLSIPDPNHHYGEIKFRPKYGEVESIPIHHKYNCSRGIGPADMAAAILTGKEPRASGELAYHVLEIMAAFDQSSRNGSKAAIGSSFVMPLLMPHSLDRGFFPPDQEL